MSLAIVIIRMNGTSIGKKIDIIAISSGSSSAQYSLFENFATNDKQINISNTLSP